MATTHVQLSFYLKVEAVYTITLISSGDRFNNLFIFWEGICDKYDGLLIECYVAVQQIL